MKKLTLVYVPDMWIRIELFLVFSRDNLEKVISGNQYRQLVNSELDLIYNPHPRDDYFILESSFHVPASPAILMFLS